MTSSSALGNCKRCGKPLTDDMEFARSIICGNCGNELPLEPGLLSPLVKKILWGSVLGIFIGGVAWTLFDQFRSIDSKLASMNESEVIAYAQTCGVTGCLAAAYKRLFEIDPKNFNYKANHAFRLTEAKKFEEAAPLYEELLKSGEVTFDLMAYAGRNYAGLGNDDKAIEWFEGALAVNPKLLDITQELSVALVRKEQVPAAISLLKAFMEDVPESRSQLEGSLIGLLKSNPSLEKPKDSSFLIYALNNGHHFTSVKFGETSEVFMIDTGATVLTVSTPIFEKHLKGLVSGIKSVKLVMADGKTAAASQFTIAQVQVGPFVIKNVEAAHCATCSSLLGRSVLKHFQMQTRPAGKLEVMKLTPAAI